MHSRYNQQKARWDADRARRDAEEQDRAKDVAHWNALNLPRKTGDALGCFRYTD